MRCFTAALHNIYEIGQLRIGETDTLSQFPQKGHRNAYQITELLYPVFAVQFEITLRGLAYNLFDMVNL